MNRQPEFENTELLQGVIFEKMTKSPEHNYYAHRLHQLLKDLAPPDTEVLKEHSLSLGSSEPEPDLSVVPGTIEDYFHQNPERALLVVEVARASLQMDRSKMVIYAAAGIPEYWILNVNQSELEVYTDPLNGSYRNTRTFSREDSVTVFGQSLSLRALFR